MPPGGRRGGSAAIVAPPTEPEDRRTTGARTWSSERPPPAVARSRATNRSGSSAVLTSTSSPVSRVTRTRGPRKQSAPAPGSPSLTIRPARPGPAIVAAGGSWKRSPKIIRLEMPPSISWSTSTMQTPVIGRETSGPGRSTRTRMHASCPREMADRARAIARVGAAIGRRFMVRSGARGRSEDADRAWRGRPRLRNMEGPNELEPRWYPTETWLLRPSISSASAARRTRSTPSGCSA